VEKKPETRPDDRNKIEDPGEPKWDVLARGILERYQEVLTELAD
jgi:hypothetical protein